MIYAPGKPWNWLFIDIRHIAYITRAQILRLSQIADGKSESLIVSGE
jgi:hypothetical protein